MQSAKTACAAALENAEGVRDALKGKNILEAAQKSSTAAYRAHSVRANTEVLILKPAPPAVQESFQSSFWGGLPDYENSGVMLRSMGLSRASGSGLKIIKGLIFGR